MGLMFNSFIIFKLRDQLPAGCLCLSYQSCPYNIGKLPPAHLPLLSASILQLSQSRTTKVYIGYLPVTTTENALKQVFERHCPVPDVIIKKANAQGQFDKYCYGFATLACGDKRAQEIIDQISEEHSGWRIKIKTQNEPRNNGMRQNQPFPGGYPMQPQQPMSMPQSQRYFYQGPQNINERGEIFGEKEHRIMVRELWLGGIPEMTDQEYMGRTMSQFGQIQGNEIFPKFAFVKFKRAIDAATAYANAAKIHAIFGSNNGFRIAFSDPSRRKDIVSNHYQLERASISIPVLFLGFPPVTSARIEIDHMLGICEKFGTITKYFLKKSTNSQMRSYFLFTYDNMRDAQRAKTDLCRRKDLLGEKRVEITLLLDEASVTSSFDFTHTLENFSVDQGGSDKLRGKGRQGDKMYQPQPPPYMGYPPMMPGYGQMVPSPYGYPPNPYGGPPGYQNYYYPQYQQQAPQKQEGQRPESNNKPEPTDMVFSLVQSMLDDKDDKAKAPQKKEDDGEDAHDIISKMLGKGNSEQEEDQDKEEKDHRQNEPNWSGFLTWRGGRRAGVDGYNILGEYEFMDYSINVTSLISNDYVVMKERSRLMVLEPTNSISQPLFQQYLKIFGQKTGVSVTKNWLIYVLGKTELSDSIKSIKENELLIVLEKANISQVIKDKIEPVDDSYFE